MHTKILISTLILFSILTSCNMPMGQAPGTQPLANDPVSFDANAMATAVELTAAARVTEIAGSVVPATTTVTNTPIVTTTPTITLTSAPVVSGPCSPTVTATVIANVRSGPGTDYDIVGSLSLGQTATIVGRNDAYTWWYIDYPGVAGNRAWIAGSVVTSACVPSVVQVVAAPPLPATPTEVVAVSDGNGNDLVIVPNSNLQLNLLLPDLVVVNMDVPPNVLLGASVDMHVKIKNTGNAAAGNFTVQWWAGSNLGCSWPVDALAAGAAKTLSCSYTFPNVGDYTVKTVVDSGATIAETNEGNNTSQETVQVQKLKIVITLPAPQLP